MIKFPKLLFLSLSLLPFLTSCTEESVNKFFDIDTEQPNKEPVEIVKEEDGLEEEPIAYSTESTIKFHGVVSDYNTDEELVQASIVLYIDNVEETTFFTDERGKYSIEKNLGHTYLLEFLKEGLVTKSVLIDTRKILVEDGSAGYEMRIDMTLFEEVPDLDVSILEKPIGKAKYNQVTGDIEWDYEHTAEIQEELKILMNEN